MKEVKYEILSTMSAIGVENGVLVMGRAFGASQDTGLHWRDGLEITLLLEGESEYYCEGRRGRYHAGELFLANSGVVFSERNARPDEYIAALAMVLPDSFITFYAPKERLHPVGAASVRVRKLFQKKEQIAVRGEGVVLRRFHDAVNHGAGLCATRRIGEQEALRPITNGFTLRSARLLLISSRPSI